jgi:phage shock protein A
MARAKQNNSLKTLLKSAISELIEENEELVRRILEEAIEDAFMTKAIKKGRSTKKISRDRIFRALSTSTR